jgi:hypothetical protein
MTNSKKHIFRNTQTANDMSIIDTCGCTEQTGQWQQYPRLSNHQLVDWVAIGAGFTGIAAARRLSQLDPNKRVLQIDGKQQGQGSSARNSGFAVAYDMLKYRLKPDVKVRWHATPSTVRVLPRSKG